MNLSVDCQAHAKDVLVALDKHALSLPLNALRAGGDIDEIRTGTQMVTKGTGEISDGPLEEGIAKVPTTEER